MPDEGLQIDLPFKTSRRELSLGVELELQVLNGKTLLLSPDASRVIHKADSEKFKQEFFQSTLEIITGICKNVQEVERDLTHSLDLAKTSAHQLGLKLSSTSTHPLADYRDRLVTPSPRYDELIDRNQWVIRRMAVYGMHIHLGMLNGDKCICYNFFFMHFLPHILALSASSPFWQGMYTGLASCRLTIYEALPTAGMPYLVQNWAEFQKLYKFLLRSSAIKSIKDLWWDLRPSPELGTVELRFCDEPATLKEVLSIVAFVHLLAHWYRDHEEEWVSTRTPLTKWIFRENKWRAIRFGLDAEIVVSRHGKIRSLREDIFHWLEVLAPYATRLKYRKYLHTIETTLTKGNSSERQHKVFEQTSDLTKVVHHNVDEFYNGEPLWE